jgi:hypothetical protein
MLQGMRYKWQRPFPNQKFILYNVFDKIAAGSDGSPLTETTEDRKTILNSALHNLELEISDSSGVEIEFVAEENSSLIDAMTKYVKYNGIDLVIMGITGANQASNKYSWEVIP